MDVLDRLQTILSLCHQIELGGKYRTSFVYQAFVRGVRVSVWDGSVHHENELIYADFRLHDEYIRKGTATWVENMDRLEAELMQLINKEEAA